MLRGIALIVVAVVVGVVLLRNTDKSTSFTPKPTGSAATSETTSTTVAAGSSTSTTVAAKAHDPSQVTILVANGTGGIKGAAKTIADKLTASNYVLKPSVDTKSPAEGSVVYFAAGYEPDARRVAALLTPPPAVQPMPAVLPVTDLARANLLVIVASDLVTGT